MKKKLIKDDVNKDIQIINSYNNVWRKNQIFAEVNKDGWSNEKEIKDNIEIRINGKPIDFSYTHKFEKKEYIILNIFLKMISPILIVCFMIVSI